MLDPSGGDHHPDLNCCCDTCVSNLTRQVLGIDLYFAGRWEPDHVLECVRACVKHDAAVFSPCPGGPLVSLYGRNQSVPSSISGRLRYRFFIVVEAGCVSKGITQKLASVFCHFLKTRDTRCTGQWTMEESWPEVDVEVELFSWSRIRGIEMWEECLRYLNTMDDLMSSGCILGSRQRVLLCLCRKLGLHSVLSCSRCSDMRHFGAMLLDDT